MEEPMFGAALSALGFERRIFKPANSATTPQPTSVPTDHPPHLPSDLLDGPDKLANSAITPQPISVRTDHPPDLPSDLLDGPDIVRRITDHEIFLKITAFFEDNPATQRSLMSPNAQALLYCLVRLLKPRDVIEIGIYQCGTSEAICRALAANGFGILHAIEPFQSAVAGEIVRQWPHGMDRFIKIYNETSMQFFMRTDERRIKPSIVLVDGDHSFEFAQFDINTSARFLNPSGFILVDNIAQPGPFLATKDFLIANPAWTVESRELPPILKGYDKHRPTVINTDFAVLRAPKSFVVDRRPRSFGPISWSNNSVSGLALTFAAPPDEEGTITVQLILRGFGAELREIIFETDAAVSGGSRHATIHPNGFGFDKTFNSYSVETILRWSGSQPLLLAEVPALQGSGA
jgi:predicted O-methyltransferase YrrM